MNEIITCFGDIIGTTSDTNSDSGLFITDLEAVETIYSLIDNNGVSDEVNLENKLLNARRIAILRLQSDLTTLMMRYAKALDGYKGVIGATKSAAALHENGKSGVRLLCKSIKDADLILTGVTLTFSQTGQVRLYLASNYSDDIIDLGLFNVIANKPVFTEFQLGEYIQPYVMSMSEDSIGERVEYYIYHENTLAPIDTKIDCASCSKFYFDNRNPIFKLYGYKQYLNVAGYNGEIGSLSHRGSNQSKGIQLHVDIRCNTYKAICNESIDFLRNPMAMSYATAVQYKAASVVVWDLIRSPKLNRILMSDMETFKDAASYYERKYNDMVKYISKNMPIMSDCFCETGFTRANIRHAV
jgi:hypothetical protein